MTASIETFEKKLFSMTSIIKGNYTLCGDLYSLTASGFFYTEQTPTEPENKGPQWFRIDNYWFITNRHVVLPKEGNDEDSKEVLLDRMEFGLRRTSVERGIEWFPVSLSKEELKENLRLHPDKGDKEALKLKSDFIITLCDLIAGGKNGLENDEKGIIDECIRHIYDAYFENPVPENMPILEDLYNALLDHKNAKAERIANSLVLYVHGSQNYFNHRTNVDSKNRIMCFDIRDLGNQLKELGMLIVQDAVWNRVSQNRERKIATRYYCDEFHLLLKERQTAIYSVEIWKRFRKWGGIPTGLTQNVGDFLKSEEIEGILGNSDFVYLLNQNAKDQAILADKLGLSEKQLSHVTNSEPGSGLILFDNVVIPFVDKYPTDTKTYAIMNTKPEESVKQEDVD